jgi:hypothetical protein
VFVKHFFRISGLASIGGMHSGVGSQLESAMDMMRLNGSLSFLVILSWTNFCVHDTWQLNLFTEFVYISS